MSRLAEIDRELAQLNLKRMELINERQAIIQENTLKTFSAKYGIKIYLGMELLGQGTELEPSISYLHNLYQDSATIGDGQDTGWRISGTSHDDIVRMRKNWIKANS